MKTWSTLNHTNLLKLVGFCIDTVTYTTLWIITDWQAFGEIPHYIKTKNADLAKRLQLVRSSTTAHLKGHTDIFYPRLPTPLKV